MVAIRPSVWKSIQSGTPSRAMTPLVGLNPSRPQNAAGMRADPAPSPAVTSGRQPGRQRRGRPAAGAARGQRRVPGVGGGAVHQVVGEPLDAELRLVGLADHDRPRRAQPGHDQAVPGGRRGVGEPPRAVRGDHPGDVVGVLDQHRQAGQGARGPGAVQGVGLLQRLLGAQGDHRVELAGRDPGQAELDERPGAGAPVGHLLGQPGQGCGHGVVPLRTARPGPAGRRRSGSSSTATSSSGDGRTLRLCCASGNLRHPTRNRESTGSAHRIRHRPPSRQASSTPRTKAALRRA